MNRAIHHLLVKGTAGVIAVQFTHRYERPGTYFAVVRVTDSTTSRGGREEVLGLRVKGIQNIASLRIVVR